MVNILSKWIAFFFFTGILLMPAISHAQDRAEALSKESLTNALLDLKMAKKDLERSKSMKPLEMFSYRTMAIDLDVMIKNLERYLYPVVKMEQEAVPIRLDGRYFSEALQNNLIIRGDTGKQAAPVSIDDLPKVKVDDLSKQDLAYLNDISNTTTVVVVKEPAKKVEKKVADKVTKPVKKDKVVKKEVIPAKASVQEREIVIPEQVIDAWQVYYNDKELIAMMKLYSENFRGTLKAKKARRKDFAREFMAYPDGHIDIYNIEAKRQGDTRDTIVSFDAELKGKQWSEYSHATFIIDRNLQIIDETWTASMPIEDTEK